MAKKRKLGNALIYLILILMSIIWLFPFVGLVLQSFRGEYGGMVDYLVPKEFSLTNYRFLFGDECKFTRWYSNTLIIALAVSALQTVIIPHALQRPQSIDEHLAGIGDVPGLSDYDLPVLPAEANGADGIWRRSRVNSDLLRQFRYGLLCVQGVFRHDTEIFG